MPKDNVTQFNADAPLEKAIAEFMGDYSISLRNLVESLDAAHISHYSSGCNSKRVTFDLFPASNYVRQLIQMLTLDRPHKIKGASMELHDVSSSNPYNPANDFIRYLKRWSGFAEQVMRNEGDSPRGIAGARAKLTIEELIQRLSEGQQSTSKTTHFAQLMRSIGLALESRERRVEEQKKLARKQMTENNYLKALSAAQEQGKMPVIARPHMKNFA